MVLPVLQGTICQGGLPTTELDSALRALRPQAGFTLFAGLQCIGLLEQREHRENKRARGARHREALALGQAHEADQRGTPQQERHHERARGPHARYCKRLLLHRRGQMLRRSVEASNGSFVAGCLATSADHAPSSDSSQSAPVPRAAYMNVCVLVENVHRSTRSGSQPTNRPPPHARLNENRLEIPYYSNSSAALRFARFARDARHF